MHGPIESVWRATKSATTLRPLYLPQTCAYPPQSSSSSQMLSGGSRTSSTPHAGRFLPASVTASSRVVATRGNSAQFGPTALNLGMLFLLHHQNTTLNIFLSI